MTPQAEPRGPKGRLLTGNLPEYRRDRLAFLTRCAREYGDFVPFRLGPRRIVLLSDPDLIKEVLATKTHQFQKTFYLRMNRLTFGYGLLTSEGDFWRHQRRLSQPAFHHDRIAEYARVMVDLTQEALDVWGDGEERDIHADLMRLTLEIAARALFGSNVTAEEAEVVATAVRTSLERFVARLESMVPLPEWIPSRGNHRLRKTIRRLDDVVYGYIRARRESGEDSGDLLSLLLHAKDDEGPGMSDRQLRDEAVTLLLAGHETTAVALTWTWLLLARHPEVATRLVDEIDQALQGRAASVADIARLPYTEMVVKESMRIYPPAYVVGRDAVREVQIGGYPVARGTTVLMSQWVVHHDPRFFDEPDAFLPERWTAGGSSGLPKYAYFPFGGGPRLCIGSTFAVTEAVLLLVTMAQCLRLTEVPGQRVELWPAITLRPKRGLRMIIERRTSHYSAETGFKSAAPDALTLPARRSCRQDQAWPPPQPKAQREADGCQRRVKAAQETPAEN